MWKTELKQWQNDNDYIEGQNITTVAESLQNYIAENEINIDMTNDNFRSLLRFWGFSKVDIRVGCKKVTYKKQYKTFALIYDLRIIG